MQSGLAQPPDRPYQRAMTGGGQRGISRRQLMIGGGAGLGLLVGWAVWPRSYAPNLNAAPGEHVFNGFVKIGVDGHVTVAVPQAEMGQGVYTTLSQIVADELGADWRTVAVEPAPISPLYANALFAEEWLVGWPKRLVDEIATRNAFVVTGGSTSVRAYERRMREAGAAARALLCSAAASRWDADWRACDTAGGFVTRGDDRMRFGEVAAQAAQLKLPKNIMLRSGSDNRLTGKSLPRLDLPSKVDGSVNYAADIRLPEMVYASIAQGPLGDTALASFDEKSARAVAGVVDVVRTERWVAVVGTNWWAADQGLAAARPGFRTKGALVGNRDIDRALHNAFENGVRVSASGDVGAAFRGASVLTADYRIGLAPHAAIEPMCATARLDGGGLQLWMGSQVPGLAIAAAAAAIDVAPERVFLHSMAIGGSFGRRYEVEVAGQVALLAQKLKRPVQLMWSRAEDMRQDRFRPAAAARMAARLGRAGRIDAWLAKIASPSTTHELKRRIYDRDSSFAAMQAAQARSSDSDVAGAVPPYAILNLAVDHHPALIGVPTGDWRGRAHGASAFFTESFVDELAAASGVDPFSYRMAMLGDNPRLALCLSKAAALGGWQGGAIGTGQGIACHTMADSHVAVLAEASLSDSGAVQVTRLVAVVDCGRVINPDVVRQQIAGGLIFGMSAATGAPVSLKRGLAGPTRLGELRLPRVADTPHIMIELINSAHAPGGVGEIAVPPAAPAIANALFAATGTRHRTLPLVTR